MSCIKCNQRCVLVEGIELTCRECGLVQPESGMNALTSDPFMTTTEVFYQGNFSKGIYDVIHIFVEKLDSMTFITVKNIASDHVDYLKSLNSNFKKVQVLSVLVSKFLNKRPDEILSKVLDTTIIPPVEWVYKELKLPLDLKEDARHVKNHLVNMMVLVMKIYKDECSAYKDKTMNQFAADRSLLSKNCFKLFDMLESKASHYIFKVKAKQLCLGVCYMASRNIKLGIKPNVFCMTGLVTSQTLFSIEKNIVKELKLRVV